MSPKSAKETEFYLDFKGLQERRIEDCDCAAEVHDNEGGDLSVMSFALIELTASNDA